MALAGALRSAPAIHPRRLCPPGVLSPAWLSFLRATRNLLAVDGWICVTRYQADLLRRALRRRRQACGGCFPRRRHSLLRSRQSEPRKARALYPCRGRRDAGLRPASSRRCATWMSRWSSRPPARGWLRSQRNLGCPGQRQAHQRAPVLRRAARPVCRRGLVAVPLHDTPQAAGITTILEGMAMGKCIVATQSSGLPDVLVDGETGLIAPPTADGLRTAITTMLESPDRRSALAIAGQRLVRTSFKLEDHAAAVATFLSACARE